MLTYEQIAQMSKQELLTAPFREIWGSLQDMDHMTKHSEDHQRIVSLFDDAVGQWDTRIKQAYDKKEADIEALVVSFTKEPALIRILAWSKMTGSGIDYARFVHKHFATAILELFGDPRF